MRNLKTLIINTKAELMAKSWLKGKKTYIISALMVAVALVNYFAGDVTLLEVLNNEDLILLLEGLGLMSLRAGVAGK